MAKKTVETGIAALASKYATKDSITKALTSLSTRGKKLKNEAAVIAIAIMQHMEKHGDYTQAPALFASCEDAFGKNMRRAMEEYFLKYTWLVFDKETKTFIKDKTKKLDIEAAIENKNAKGESQPWYATERDTTAAPYDYQKAIANLLARAIKDGINPDTITETFTKELNEAKLKASKDKTEKLQAAA